MPKALVPQKRKHPGGRPTKLTPEVQQRIVTILAAGNRLEVAPAFAGIAESTFYKWLKEGARCDSGIQHEFSEAVKKALAQAEVRDVATIELAAQSQWQAAAWRLERRYPQVWGRVERHEQTGEGGGPIVVRVVYDDPGSQVTDAVVDARELPQLE